MYENPYNISLFINMIYYSVENKALLFSKKHLFLCIFAYIM